MQKNVEEYLAFKRGEKSLPGHLSIQLEKTNRLFKNKVIETLSRTHVSVPIIMHLSIVAAFIYCSLRFLEINVTYYVSIYFVGLISWSFTEYVMHRFFYHTETNSSRFYKVQHNIHGIHHQHPQDRDRLALPPVPALILASIFFTLFWILMGINAVAFFPGFLTGYVIYVSMHYAQHIIVNPTYGPWKKLWRHHAWHHYKNPYVAFGVSTRLWDFVFGTMPPKEIHKK